MTDDIEVTIQGSGELQMGFSFSGKSSVLTLTGGVDCDGISTQTGGTLNISSNLSENEGVTFYGGLTVTGTAQSPCTVNISGGRIQNEPLTVTGTENGAVNMEVTGGEIETLTVNGTEEQANVTLNGGAFGKIECTTEGRTVGSLLPSQDYGYYNMGTGKWEESTETSIQSDGYIHVKILPLTGVTLTSSGTTSISTEEYEAGQVPTFTANVARPEGATGELEYWWTVYSGTGAVYATSADDIKKSEFIFPTNLGSGTFTVECKVSDAKTGLSYTATAQVHIGKSLVPETWYPSGAEGLTYNGYAQCLVDQAFIDDVYDGVKVIFYFRLGEDGSWNNRPANMNAKNTGMYTVYWYIDGADNYESVGSATNPQSFQVTIAPATVTVTSVDVDEKNYDGLTTATVLSVGFGSDAADCEYTATAEFDDPNAGEDKSFTATVTLTDSNYTFRDENGQPTDTCTVRGTGGVIQQDISTYPSSEDTLTVYNRFAHTYEYDFSPLLENLKASLPNGCTLGQFSYGEIGKYGGDESLKSIVGELRFDKETGKLSLPIQTRDSDQEVTLDGRLRLSVQINSQNYNDVGLYLNIHFRNLDKQPLTVSLDGWSYGEAPKALTYGAESLVLNDDAETTITYTGTDSAGTAYNSTTPPTNAGNYTVAVSILDTKSSDQPQIYEGSASFSITKADLSGVSVSQTGTLTYNGNPQTAEVNATATAVNGQSVSFTYSDAENGTYTGTVPSFTDVKEGGYTVYYKASAANHNDATGYFTVTIGKATPTITNATATVTYGDVPTGSVITAATGGVAGSFEWNVDSYGDATNGAPRTMQAIFKPTDTTNYNDAVVYVSVTVNKADLPTSEYPTGLTGTKGNKLSTVELPTGWSWVSGNTDMNDLGNQTFAANYAGSNNYNAADGVNLTVNVSDKNPQIITANDLTATYGETGKKINATRTGDGIISYAVKSGSEDILNVDAATGVLTFKKAGTATVTVSVSETETYAARSMDVTVTVNKAALTVTAKNQSINVNNTVPDLSNPAEKEHYTVTGLVNGDTLSVTMEYQKDGSAVTPDVTKAGSYEIAITATADAEKYEITNTPGTLTISKPSSGNSGGGGGSSSGNTTITVPVTSDHATVEVKAEVSKGNATVEVSDKQIEKVIADHAGEVTIDVSDLKNVESATVPSHVVEKTNEAENTGLTVSLPAGSVTLDETALGSVTENANGKDVTVSVVAVSTEKLSEVVKEVIGMEPTVLAVVDVNVIISGKKQSSFDGGKVTVSIPYTPKKGEDIGKLTVWFIRDDGTIENKGGYYDAKNKCFVFETDHLSQYILVNTNDMQTFEDVPADAYFANAVSWAAGKGITGGVDATHFMPNNACTRAQIVTFLWRAAGSPEPKAASSFTDVSENAYYAKAVAWAVENGITGGIGNNRFAPDLTCTRAQAAAFLFRYAAANGMDAVTLQELVGGYGDAAQVPGYAIPAFNWALAQGIVNGYNGNLMPNNDCTRAQIVTMLYRMLGK